jgi:hypothetical protein
MWQQNKVISIEVRLAIHHLTLSVGDALFENFLGCRELVR